MKKRRSNPHHMSKEVYCPECKYTFVDEGGGTAASDEEAHIANYAKCYSCKKAWQHGELDWQIREEE